MYSKGTPGDISYNKALNNSYILLYSFIFWFLGGFYLLYLFLTTPLRNCAIICYPYMDDEAIVCKLRVFIGSNARQPSNATFCHANKVVIKHSRLRSETCWFLITQVVYQTNLLHYYNIWIFFSFYIFVGVGSASN